MNSVTTTQSRRSFLKTAGTLSAGLILPRFITANSRQSKQPNILFILTDDQGVHELNCYGNPYYYSPNIDRLAKEGILFTNAYAACPVCSPTRASIMTGKYPARLHITDYIPGIENQPENKLLMPDWKKQLPLEEFTLAEALKSAGYATGHFGKWHLNFDKKHKPGRAGDPGSQGFDDVLTTVKPKKSADPNSDPHHVKEITDRAINFIEKNNDNPFFCYVSHDSIHNPKMENEALINKYKNKSGSELGKNVPVIGAMIETLDSNIGRLLNKLDELKITENTIVIYFADNGCSSAIDVLKPLRGGKAQLYEGGIKEPLIIRWPSVIKPGIESNVHVCSIDFFPTLLSACGINNNISGTDGINLLPILDGDTKKSERPIFWHYPHYHPLGISPSGAVRKGNYKLIEWYEISIEGVDKEGALELFDLENDPSEQTNIIKSKPELAKELYNEFRNWKKNIGAQEVELNPNYQPGIKKKKSMSDEDES